MWRAMAAMVPGVALLVMSAGARAVAPCLFGWRPLWNARAMWRTHPECGSSSTKSYPPTAHLCALASPSVTAGRSAALLAGSCPGRSVHGGRPRGKGERAWGLAAAGRMDQNGQVASHGRVAC